MASHPYSLNYPCYLFLSGALWFPLDVLVKDSQGEWTQFSRAALCNFHISLLFQWEITLEGKSFVLEGIGANSFLLRVEPFSERFCHLGKKNRKPPPPWVSQCNNSSCIFLHAK